MLKLATVDLVPSASYYSDNVFLTLLPFKRISRYAEQQIILL